MRLKIISQVIVTLLVIGLVVSIGAVVVKDVNNAYQTCIHTYCSNMTGYNITGSENWTLCANIIEEKCELRSSVAI